jgi:hypothetical protein
MLHNIVSDPIYKICNNVRSYTVKTEKTNKRGKLSTVELLI